MNDGRPAKTSRHELTFAEQVGAKAARKLNARRHSAQGVWFRRSSAPRSVTG
jgi:hypothetical protein